jgi:hypothetical protein
MKMILVSLLAIALVAAPGCAGHKAPVDVQVLHTGTNVLTTVAALQRGVTQATDAKLLPVAQAKEITGYVEKAYAKSGSLEEAVKALHTATNLDVKATKVAEVQVLVGELNALLGQAVGVKVPEGALSELMKLYGGVMTAVAQVQAEVAKGLGS